MNEVLDTSQLNAHGVCRGIVCRRPKITSNGDVGAMHDQGVQWLGGCARMGLREKAMHIKKAKNNLYK